jgi:hypothetical protein
MPEDTLTPRVERHLLEQLANDNYRRSAKGIEVFGCTISHVQAGRVLEDAGDKVHSELYGPDAILAAEKKAPKNPAELLLVEPDGARYRTNEADKRKKRRKDDTAKAELTDCPCEAESAVGSPDDEIRPKERDQGWRENKMAVVIRMVPGKTGPDGSYTKPKELVKSYVGTTRDSRAFGRDLRTEAERRGIKRAKEVVFLGDHGHGMPEMIEREFADVEKQVITDFYHGAERLGDVAAVIKGAGEAKGKKRFEFFLGLRSKLWNGEAKGIAKRLGRFASRLAPRPTTLTELDANPDAKKLWEHAMYFEKHVETMDYPEYRAKGWPIGSGAVESACGQFGDRVKHARMRWTRKRADALHVVKAAILSGDDRWQKRWPPPIPVLDVAPSTMAAYGG